MTSVMMSAPAGALPSSGRARRATAYTRLGATVLVATGWAAVTATVLLSGQAPDAAPAGLPDAGRVIAWTVLLSRTLLRLAALGAIGSLLTAAWLLPAETSASTSAARSQVTRVASRWAVVWLVSAVVSMLATSAQLLGVPLRTALTTTAAWGYVPQLAEGRALMLMAPAVLLIVLHAGRSTSLRGARGLLVLGLLALLPFALTGHAASAGNHYLASQSLVVHLLFVTLWVGGLLGLVHLRSDAPLLSSAATRFSTLALVCFAVVAASGLLSAGTRLGLEPAAWTSSYGALVIAKSTLLVALGVAGLAHRRRTLPALAAGRRGAFRRLAAVELLVMAAATGVGVALARTAPPVRADVVASPHPGVTVDRGLLALSPVRLLVEVELGAGVVTVVGALAVAHLLAMAPRLRAREAGALAAVAWFLAGLALLLWALVGGLAAYQSALFSAHVAQLLVCAVVVPRLLARGLEPLRRAEGDSLVANLLRRAGEPLNGALLLALLLVGVYATPVLEHSLRIPAERFLITLVVLGVGWATVAGRRAASPRADRPTAAVLALFGAATLATPRLYAEDWFGSLAWTWSNPATDQRVAGLLMLGLAVALVVRGEWSARLRQRTATAEEPAASRASIA